MTRLIFATIAVLLFGLPMAFAQKQAEAKAGMTDLDEVVKLQSSLQEERATIRDSDSRDAIELDYDITILDIVVASIDPSTQNGRIRIPPLLGGAKACVAFCNIKQRNETRSCEPSGPQVPPVETEDDGSTQLPIPDPCVLKAIMDGDRCRAGCYPGNS